MIGDLSAVVKLFSKLIDDGDVLYDGHHQNDAPAFIDRDAVEGEAFSLGRRLLRGHLAALVDDPLGDGVGQDPLFDDIRDIPPHQLPGGQAGHMLIGGVHLDGQAPGVCDIDPVRENVDDAFPILRTQPCG